MPVGATTGRISVTNEAGLGKSDSAFTVIRVPVVASIEPSSGGIGTELTLTGTDFGGVSEVSFGGAASEEFTVRSDTEIRARVPVAAATGQITVKNAAGSGQSPTDFTVIDLPAIASFEPRLGIPGTEVTLTGLHFTGVTDVSISGRSAANVIFDSDSKLRVQIPSGATTGKLNVTNPVGTGASLSEFTVLQAPVISSFAPLMAPAQQEITVALAVVRRGLPSAS